MFGQLSLVRMVIAALVGMLPEDTANGLAVNQEERKEERDEENWSDDEPGEKSVFDRSGSRAFAGAGSSCRHLAGMSVSELASVV